jgi:hypothetical protein
MKLNFDENNITTTALSNLCPNGWSWNGKELTTRSDDVPTQVELDAEVDKLKKLFDTLAYARNRKIDYDDLNQLELMTDDAINSTTTHLDAIAAIKTKWPKDNSGPIE